jgi:hypothetical protein
LLAKFARWPVSAVVLFTRTNRGCTDHFHVTHFVNGQPREDSPGQYRTPVCHANHYTCGYRTPEVVPAEIHSSANSQGTVDYTMTSIVTGFIPMAKPREPTMSAPPMPSWAAAVADGELSVAWASPKIQQNRQNRSARTKWREIGLIGVRKGTSHAAGGRRCGPRERCLALSRPVTGQFAWRGFPNETPKCCRSISSYPIGGHCQKSAAFLKRLGPLF